MPETKDGYALARGGNAYWLASFMRGRWVSQATADDGVEVTQIHPRLPEIRRAGGDYRSREIVIDGKRHMEYTLTAVPRIVGLSEADRRAMVIIQPGDNDPPSRRKEGWYKAQFRNAA